MRREKTKRLKRKEIRWIRTCLFLYAFFPLLPAAQGTAGNTRFVPVDSGWAANSINTTIFRKNSLVSFKDTQFVAFYNAKGMMVLGKRKVGEAKWLLKQTSFKGNVADAHNIISIMVDGDGYLHCAWDHHNNPLHYARSIAPGSLEVQPSAMTGIKENKLSYPEFYRLSNGDLLFFYRDGGSGNGNLIINRYDVKAKRWVMLQSNLIDGEGARNAYWQACVDAKGTVHLSWVWRESPDVASNHDLCYARSVDGGATWEKSTGERYALPINAATAEIAQAVPQKSELINQTSMTTDAAGNPFIATYWREGGTGVPQYHLVFKNKSGWQTQNLGFRKTAFSLSGAGTKRIPVSRPQIVAWQNGTKNSAAMIFRDEERGNKVSAAVCDDLQKASWRLQDLGEENVGSWEPSFDTELWKQKKRLHLFVQRTEQADAEGKSALPPQMVKVLEWKPK